MPYQFLLFLAVFTGLALIGYSLTPKKHRYLALLAASVVAGAGRGVTAVPYQFLLFLAVFTGLALIGYSLTPKKHRYLALLAASVVCVVAMSGYAAVFVAITVVTTYAAGRLMDAAAKGIDLTRLDKSARKAAKAKIKHRKKLVVAGYALVDLGILLVLKYFNFFSSAASHLVNLMGGDSAPVLVRLALPLGLSYYTLLPCPLGFPTTPCKR